MSDIMRLDRFLAGMGLGTRTEVKDMIKKGRILVDGIPAKDPGEKIDPAKNRVAADQKPLSWQKYRYYLLHNPAGSLSATEDRHKPVVTDFLPPEAGRDLFPVGRLDLDTEGLLLLTNDGELAHQLLSPKKHVPKTYYALVRGELPPDVKERFLSGIALDKGETARPAELKILDSRGDPEGETVTGTELTIYEGKFHEVKRMFNAVGGEVIYLRRIFMGPLVLPPELKPGGIRELTEEEKNSLLALTGLSGRR